MLPGRFLKMLTRLNLNPPWPGSNHFTAIVELPTYPPSFFQARLAPNAVTLGDFSRPLQISKFIKDIHAGFQLLNLKNDTLRRRSDGIKYAVSLPILPLILHLRYFSSPRSKALSQSAFKANLYPSASKSGQESRRRGLRPELAGFTTQTEGAGAGAA